MQPKDLSKWKLGNFNSIGSMLVLRYGGRELRINFIMVYDIHASFLVPNIKPLKI
jgi:hypothetical protein